MVKTRKKIEILEKKVYRTENGEKDNIQHLFTTLQTLTAVTAHTLERLVLFTNKYYTYYLHCRMYIEALGYINIMLMQLQNMKK